MAYKGKYNPKNPGKYIGNIKDIVWRSLWERGVMKWCDENTNVIKWNSEGVVIPYVLLEDNSVHRYFMDFYIQFSNGKKVLVEVKPSAQTKPPKQSPKSPNNYRSRNRLIKETRTYSKNISKWKAAKSFADKHGMEFLIWTEYHLKELGITIVK